MRLTDIPIVARLIGWGIASILFMLLLLAPMWAHATGSKPSPSPTPSQTSSASSASNAQAGALASSAAQGYGGNANAYGGSGGNGFGGAASASGFGGSVSDNSNYYVLPAVIPVSGGSLPAGMCQTSGYKHSSRSFLLFGWSDAEGQSHTDMDCLNAILTLQRFRAEAAMHKPEPRIEAKPGERLYPICKPAPTKARPKRKVCK